MQILREHILQYYFPVEQGHSVPPKSMEEPFSKGFSWQMGDNFWEANLLRGYSAWGINDQIIMLRAGEFCLGKASKDCLLRFALRD